MIVNIILALQEPSINQFNKIFKLGCTDVPRVQNLVNILVSYQSALFFRDLYILSFFLSYYDSIVYVLLRAATLCK